MDEAAEFEKFERNIGRLFASGEMDGADAVQAIEEYIDDHADAYRHDEDERYYELMAGVL